MMKRFLILLLTAASLNTTAKADNWGDFYIYLAQNIKYPASALNLCVNKTYAQEEKLYNFVSLEKPPSYPGGMAKFYEFLIKSIIYPKAAFDSKVQGTAIVSFVIEKDGSLTDVKTEGRRLGAGLDEEAVRVLKLSQKWNPGLINGKPVRVKYNIPIKFAMKK